VRAAIGRKGATKASESRDNGVARARMLRA
jgi:hypothetical protein